MIRAILEEFPQHADGHGEAEGHDSQEEGRQSEGEALSAVQHIHQSKADGCAGEAVESVEHRIPMGNDDVEVVNLAQYLRRVDKKEDDDLQRVRR